MKALLMVLALAVVGPAHAEDKTCQLGEMHCEDCAQMVKDKVCSAGQYSTCDVKLIDANKQLGQMHLITKDEKAKIDQKALNALIKDAGYTLNKCSDAKIAGKKG